MHGRLGSGLFDMGLPMGGPVMPLGSGMFMPPPAPLKKKLPLGSGLFEFDTVPGAFPLGSGLHGQAPFPVHTAQGVPTPGQPPNNTMQSRGGEQGAPQKVSFDERIGGLLNNPAFLLGMNLMGGASQPGATGLAFALQNTLAAQAQAATAKRAEAQARLEEQRFGLEGKRFEREGQRFERQDEMAERQFDLAQERLNMGYDEMDLKRAQMEADAELRRQQAEIQARFAATGERKAALDERQLALQAPLWAAQAQRYGTEANIDQQRLALERQKLARQQQWMDQLGGTMSGLFQQPAAPVPQEGLMPQSAPGVPPKASTPVDWARVNQAYASGQPQRETERTQILREELATATDPELRAAIERDLARQGVALEPVGPQAQGPVANKSMQLAQAGVMASAAGLPGGSQLMDLAKMAQPQNVPAGGYVRDPFTGVETFRRDPYKEAELNPERQGAITQAKEDAKASAEAKAESAKAAKKSNQMLGVVEQAERLLEQNPTGSYLGAIKDQATRALGIATPSSKAAAELETLSGWMVSNVPRMEGPQSDRDAKIYQEMAGKLGDRTVPVEERKAALKRLKEIQETYKHLNAGAPEQAAPGSAAPIPLEEYLKQKRGGK